MIKKTVVFFLGHTDARKIKLSEEHVGGEFLPYEQALERVTYDNAKAALITRGLAEMARLGEAMGADPETFAGLAGMGDLIVTCWHPSGRNRRAGELMARGASAQEALAEIGQVVEGLTTATVLRDLARRLGIEMPITEGVCSVLEGRPLHELAADLMGRRPTAE